MNKKPKIMQVVHSMNIAGAEKVVYDIVTGLDGHISSSICCLDFIGPLGEELKSKGFKIFDLGRNPGVDFSIIYRLAKLLIQEKVDIVHAHQYTPYFYGATAAILARRPRIIFTEHGRHQPDRRRWKRIVYNKFLNLFTDAITGVSEFSKNSLAIYEGFPKERIKVIYNGIQPELFNVEVDVKEKKKKLGLSGEDKVIGIIARLDPVKDHMMLLKAFSEVIKEILEVKLLVVGDGQLRRELEEATEVLNIANNVKFLGVRRDIPELLKIFDVFVLSSLSEATSVTLLEAMASGLPVVVTDVGGNPEIVAEGKTGLLVPRGDYKKMANVLVDILNNPLKGKEMGPLGKERVRALFTIDRMTKEYLDLFLSISN